ncbi:hypothetical protein F3N42_08405 [Marinihelvus fidelis]|uniref:histidine kinase n=1 Tax=Marinihelvus fidelis TaxID=2613842 RepID=A0A5N0TA52_9GAMM|nr:ATP-binding protein [Marinihelvus fidelis]KAA9131334.1 hypothetical protein F3N42_08405 [Marinihelvus fidelis]
MSLIEELDTAVVELDAANCILRVNGAAEQCLSANRDRLAGHPIDRIWGIPEPLYVALQDIRTDYRPRRLHECKMAGGFYDCHIGVLDAGHLLLEFHSTGWSRQQQQLQQMEVQTGLLNLLRRNLGHEIRNPLGGIRGAAQMLVAELEERELGTLAQLIIREVDRVEELIQSFWQPQMEREPLDIHRALEEALQLLETEHGFKINVVRDYDPSIPEVNGDGTAIRQLFVNLARNAAQSGATTISARTRVEHDSALFEHSGYLIRVDVEDDGDGVPERLRPLLFLPMVTGRRDGTGLGLALAQQIAADHGGLMSYDALEHGSRFTLRIPARENGHE